MSAKGIVTIDGFRYCEICNDDELTPIVECPGHVYTNVTIDLPKAIPPRKVRVLNGPSTNGSYPYHYELRFSTPNGRLLTDWQHYALVGYFHEEDGTYHHVPRWVLGAVLNAFYPDQTPEQLLREHGLLEHP